MRHTTRLLSSLLSLGALARADVTWPSANDELEELMYQVGGTNNRGFGAKVVPCTTAVSPGRLNSAAWLRTGFHDMGTANVALGTGGLDASILYELGSSDNTGTAFYNTLAFMNDFYTSRSSLADLIALGVYYSVRSCGGPAVPVRGGRVDATQAGPIGIPAPENSIFTMTQQFARMGLSNVDMIQLTACGHSIGGVHELENPLIVTPGSTPVGGLTFDTTPPVFDNKVMTEYLAGTTKNPLVVGKAATNDRNSDFKIYNSDNNVTVQAMANSFNAVCKPILQKMIDVVPPGVQLTDPIQPYNIKPSKLQLTLQPGAAALKLTGFIRVRVTSTLTAASITSLTITYKDRDGGSKCGGKDCTSTSTQQGNSTGFDDSFIWFPLDVDVPASSGISSFTIALNMASGGTQTFDNNGNAYPVSDAIVLQKPQSCLDQSTGTLKVTAAVRNDRNGLPVNLAVAQKVSQGDGLPVYKLSSTTTSMARGDCAGAYTLYTATYAVPGNVTYSAKIDVVSGTGASAAGDYFHSGGDLSATCGAFEGAAAALCSTATNATTSAAPSPSSNATVTSTARNDVVSSSSASLPVPTTSVPANATWTGDNSTFASAPVTSTSSDVVSSSSSLASSTSAPANSTITSAPVTSTLAPSPSSNGTAGTTTSSGSTTSGTTTSSGSSTSGTTAPTGLSHIDTIGGYNLMGCQKEATSGRALSGASFAYNGMTLETCMKNCTGFSYFGTEYGRECYCGNTLASSSQNTSIAECNIPCSGNAKQYCGASSRLELYVTSVLPPSPTATLAVKPTVAPAYQRLGCYTEASAGRALTGASSASNDMTLELCASKCAGFTFFGAEYGRECYCGNTLSSTSTLATSGCNMPCAGDQFEYCGGTSRLELYSLNGTTPAAAAAAAPAAPTLQATVAGGYALVGCQTEGSGGKRALSAKSTSSGTAMTLETCASFCKNYNYFGTEYGGECYCGNALDASSNATAAADCKTPCTGNATQACGAAARLSLYHTNTTSAPSAPAAVGAYNYLGCRAEPATGGRALAAKSTTSAAGMTLEACASFCGAYKLFGTEYGSECYCGDALAAGAGVAAEADCSKACSGNAAERCGNGNRLSVYQRA